MTKRRPHKPRSAAAIIFYTQCRHWHGYLSAFAFLALIFFSATGILLNHPDWLSEDVSAPRTVVAVLPADGVASARHVKDVGRALAALATTRLPIVGAYSSADIDGRQAFLRYEGVKGSSDVTVDLK
ncbi:MAG TPA: PepSY-associated TM helix domain-containing protein, partial [Tepidisphaeraceae bacterium]|nr:PepSY-associated TM helix domain-containing protein [Tepidisphaeraceae bacterium]